MPFNLLHDSYVTWKCLFSTGQDQTLRHQQDNEVINAQ
jgi:hypothetical protein